MAYFILRKIIAPLIKLIFIKEVRGFENLPKKGPFIIAANHSSYVDAVLLWCVFVPFLNKPVCFIGVKWLGKYWWSRLILGKYLKTLFVNGSIHEGIEKVKEGNIVVIFPEGGRTFDGKLHQIEGTGTGALAYASRAPVIPVGIQNTFELWPRYNTFPKLKKIVEINVGKKMFFRNKKVSKKEIKDFIRTIMIAIARLCGERYVKNHR